MQDLRDEQPLTRGGREHSRAWASLGAGGGGDCSQAGLTEPKEEGRGHGRAAAATHLVHGHLHLHVLVFSDFWRSLGFRARSLGFVHITFWRKTAQTGFHANAHCTSSGPNQSHSSATSGLPLPRAQVRKKLREPRTHHNHGLGTCTSVTPR